MSDDPGSVTAFYDILADDYHLIFADWQRSLRRQGAVLDALVRERWGDHRRTVLDCACGIGTQALGLALQGYRVTATDISPHAVARMEREARALSLDVPASVADIRTLHTLGGTFDLVIACDNALPHLLTDDDLLAAARSMWARLEPHGGVLISLRDYDALGSDRPTSTPPQTWDGGNTVTFQLWRWSDDATNYVVEQFILRRQDDTWRTISAATTYRALQRDDLTNILHAAGFEDVRWHLPAATGFYQPIVTASKQSRG